MYQQVHEATRVWLRRRLKLDSDHCANYVLKTQPMGINSVDLQRSRALLKIVFSGDQALTAGSPILFPSLKTSRWTYPVQVYFPGPFIT